MRSDATHRRPEFVHTGSNHERGLVLSVNSGGIPLSLSLATRERTSQRLLRFPSASEGIAVAASRAAIARARATGSESAILKRLLLLSVASGLCERSHFGFV